MNAPVRASGAVIAAFSALVFGAGAGWTFYGHAVPGKVEATDPTAKPHEEAFDLRHGGIDVDAARATFEAMRWGAAEPEALPVETPPPPPPPPDIAVLLRQDVTAIEETPRGPLLWVVDSSQVFARRAVPVGGEYRDGWKVVSISPQTIEIRRRREVRRVSLFDTVAP